MFGEETRVAQFIEVAGGGYAGDIQVLLDELDLGVGVVEEIVDQVLAVKTVLLADALLVVLKSAFDTGNGVNGLDRGLLDSCEDVVDPLFPSVICAHFLQEAVVVLFRLQDVAAEVEGGDVQQAFFDEVEDIDDAPAAPIAIVERVDGFETMMDQRHLDERIHAGDLRIIDKCLQIVHEMLDLTFVLGWSVDGFACAIVFQGGSRHPTKACVVLFQHTLDGQNGLVGEQAVPLDGVESLPDGLAVAEDFLGGGRQQAFVAEVFLEQFIMGGDDVLNFRAVLRLLNGEGIDQDALARDAGCLTLQFCELASGGIEPFEKGDRLKTGEIQLLEWLHEVVRRGLIS